jgi:hypothetical protein
MKPLQLTLVSGAVALAFAGTGCRTTPASHTGALRPALIFHASFDQGADADFARGDRACYTAPARNQRAQAKPGLHAGDAVKLAPGAGRFGGALEFKGKTKEQVFFKGPENLGFRTNDWSGACSFWLRLDPDKDLEPGYCDPLQYVGQAWGEGNMFVEFSKDHTPRHFRYAIMAVTKLWNPNNEKWEEMKRRPMVANERPPFRRDRWTHVVFCFGNANTGRPDGWGKLYLDGVYQGEFRGWQNTFNWDASQSALTLGLNYVGFLDDVAVFNRALTDAEVRALHRLPQGVGALHAR